MTVDRSDSQAAGSPYSRRLVDGLLDELLMQLPAVLIVGPRAAGKTTTAKRRVKSVVRLDRESEAVAFAADPDSALQAIAEPVLLDEWQSVPGVLGAVRRAVEQRPTANRFLVTGSVRAELDNQVWPATGRLVRVAMYPMTVREQVGQQSGPTFLDKLAAKEELTLPADVPDLRGYLELAMQGGFPDPALRLTGSAHRAWLESYIADLLTHDVQQLEQSTTKQRDPRRLRQYFEAYALNSAGIVDDKTLVQAAGVNRATAASYEHLLTRLLIVEQVPAWTSNRLKRLVRQPKRYVIDPALVAAALRVDVNGILGDGDLLGRILDTFVLAQLRPELDCSATQPRLHHLRTKEGRQEIDLIVELAGEQLVAIEVKASAGPTAADAKHLTWLRDEVQHRFVAGIVLHTGPHIYQLDEKIFAVPMAAMWG